MLLRAVRAAAVAALASWGVLVALCVVGWLSTSATTVPMSAAVGVGSLVWSVANLGSVTDGTTTISLLPLGLVLWPLAAAALAVRSLRADVGSDDSPRLDRLGGIRRGTATALGAFVASYAVLGVVLSALGRLVPMHPVWWQTLLGSVVVGTLGVVVGLRRDLVRPAFAPGWNDRVRALAPVAARRGATAGLQGAGLLLAAGCAPLVAAVVIRWGQVAGIQTDLHPGIVGGALLVLGQLLLLPNLAAWGLSWLAGPGFTAGAGSTFTWTRSESAVLPNIPLFGALPDTASHSAWWTLVLLVPVAVGGWTAWRALGTVSRLSSAGAKAQSVAVAIVTTTILALLALVLSGGALGTRSLASVGPRSLATAAALLGELALGAVVVLGWSVLRFNRGRRA